MCFLLINFPKHHHPAIQSLAYYRLGSYYCKKLHKLFTEIKEQYLILFNWLTISPHNKSTNVYFFWRALRITQHAVNVFMNLGLGTIHIDERQVMHDSSNLKECNKYKIRTCSLLRVNIKYTNTSCRTKQYVTSVVEISECRQKTQNAIKWLYIPKSQYKKHWNMIFLWPKHYRKENIFTCESM
jgi:hypothetical protein